MQEKNIQNSEKEKSDKKDVPIPPTADVPAPIEAPPSEEKPAIKDDRDAPKQIL